MLSEQDVLSAADTGSVLQGSILATLHSKLLAGASACSSSCWAN
jgi:hypothetical protein